MSEVRASLAADPIAEVFPELDDFSLVLGGPLFQLLRLAHLSDDVANHLRHRLLVLVGLTWLPLAVLSSISGTLMGGITIPFLSDIETHARFLVAVPLMIIAEVLVHQRMRDIVGQFTARKLIPASGMERFLGAVRSAVRWRNSIAVEIVLMIVVLTIGHYVRRDLLQLHTSTWYAVVSGKGTKLTLPGLWLFWVSNPIMQFLVVRWLFRIGIWSRFLFEVSQIRLELIPTHPDRNGGLGFLSSGAFACSPLLAAFGADVAGFIATRIFLEGASLADFKLEIVMLLGGCLLLVLGPMAVFAPQIIETKRKGLQDYGALAAEYTRAFDRRWIRSEQHDGQQLLGTSDLQSLADLDNAFTVISEMRAVPFTRDTLIQLTLATTAPFIPLIFTMFPFNMLLGVLVKAVF